MYVLWVPGRLAFWLKASSHEIRYISHYHEKYVYLLHKGAACIELFHFSPYTRVQLSIRPFRWSGTHIT